MWSNNESTEDINNLSPGNYIIELTDGNGCIDSVQVNIGQPDSIYADFILKNIANRLSLSVA